MKRLILITLCLGLLSGCAFRKVYLVFPQEGQVVFINKGDRIIRADERLKPQEVILDYSGVVISDKRYEELKQAEEENTLNK